VIAQVKKQVRMARQVHEHSGAVGVAFLILRRVLRLARIHLEWFRVMEQRPETAEVPGSEPLVPTWVTATADTERLTALGRSPEIVRRRLADGDSAAILTEDGELIAQLWIQPGGVYDEDGVRFRLADEEAWVFDGVVAESRRGERIYPRLAVGVARDLDARGFVRMLSTIDEINGPSLRAAEARGCTVLGTVLVMRVWGPGVLRQHWRGRRPAWRGFHGTVSLVPPPR
jgi:hypothetical protein